MKHIFLKSTALVLLSGMLLFSCKDKETDPDLDSNTTTDNANSQSSFDDIGKVTEDALGGNSSARTAAGGTNITCGTVSIDTISTSYKKLTITFDPLCTGYDGKVRSGKIIAHLFGGTSYNYNYNTPGHVVLITLDNYKVNGNQIKGMRKDSCTKAGVHDITVSDSSTAMSGYASITYTNGETAQWKSKRTRALVSKGANTSPAAILDNVYEISYDTTFGNPAAQGINRHGKSYTVDITKAIRIDFNCFTTNQTARYPTQGVLNITPEGKLTRSIDYGNGDCDNNVKVTIGGKTYEITLIY